VKRRWLKVMVLMMSSLISVGCRSGPRCLVSQIAPELTVAPQVVQRGAEATITGRWFVRFGDSCPPKGRPLHSVVLTIDQGSARRRLGTVDATGQRGDLRLVARVPRDLHPGPAVVTATGGGRAAVTIG